VFLTRFDLNPARRGTRQLLGSPQAMHAAVMASWPPAAQDNLQADPEAARILWRLDRNDNPKRVRLYCHASDLVAEPVSCGSDLRRSLIDHGEAAGGAG
jgi:hypothetical protein